MTARIALFFPGLMLAASGMVIGLPAAGAAIPAAAQPRVHIAQGELAGTLDHGARAFLGIPYAEPPVGEQRWRAPRPAQGWHGTRDASRFGPNCMQDAPARFGPWTAEFLIDPAMSEDCLTLSVWTPPQGATARAPARLPARLPVMVWIHGGGFGSGSGSIPIYNGGSLAAQGIVVVNVNYRVGIFGFFAHPALEAESAQHTAGNYGLLDLVEALHWVQANIAQFGGDPAQVTIAGQSAGAAAVHDLAAMPLARGLFARGIAESGSGMGIPFPQLAEAEKIGEAVQRAAGATSLAGLRKLPAAQLQSLRLPPPPSNAGGSPPLRFAPLADGKVLPTSADQGGAVPASPVPMLTGFTTDEARSMGPVHVSPADFEKQVQERYGAFAARLLALYPHADDAQSLASFYQLARDRYMASLAIWSVARTAARSEPVYAYLFDHVLPGPEAERYRSFHTAEVPYVFGVLDQGGRPFSDADHAVSRQLQGYWLNFVRKGDPNGPGLPRWERFNAASGKVMELGDHPGPVWPASSGERYQALRDYAMAGGQLTML